MQFQADNADRAETIWSLGMQVDAAQSVSKVSKPVATERERGSDSEVLFLIELV